MTEIYTNSVHETTSIIKTVLSFNVISEMSDVITIDQKSKRSSKTGKLFSIMSKDYRQSRYTDAISVSCHIDLHKTHVENRNMKLDVREFTTYSDSSKFCLSINGKQEFCSGSVSKKNGIYPAKIQWTLKMEMTSSSKNVQVRYWLDIAGQ